jgi:hypothetical protein
MNDIQPGEVQITPIHDIDGAGFQQKDIQNVDVMDFAIGDGDKRGNTVAQGPGSRVVKAIALRPVNGPGMAVSLWAHFFTENVGSFIKS